MSTTYSNENWQLLFFFEKILEKPLLLEGMPGVERHMLAKLCRNICVQIIRLQCYGSLDVSTTITNGIPKAAFAQLSSLSREIIGASINQIFFLGWIMYFNPLLQCRISAGQTCSIVD